MRILGVHLVRPTPSSPRVGEHTIVLLDEAGGVERWERPASLPEVATTVGRLAADEPFLLGVDVPVVVPDKPARARRVENLIRRKLGIRLPPGGRASLTPEAGGVAGETLMAGLAAAGHPCLPYPDRSRRRHGLVETHPQLILKALLWESSSLAGDDDGGATRFGAYGVPAYRPKPRGGRDSWHEQAVALDLILRALRPTANIDFAPIAAALRNASDAAGLELAGGLLDGVLVASVAHRYLSAPETCIFLGDQETGYLIAPADEFLRRLVTDDRRRPSDQLFPHSSLKDRLGPHAQLRSRDLLSVPGRPPRMEASFREPPRYEFDNLDEMLWWKHCRHLTGPTLPTEGLAELDVVLEGEDVSLRLVRSRHRTLSFRFDPPRAWRARVPVRDGRTYPFRVTRAVFETLPVADSV